LGGGLSKDEEAKGSGDQGSGDQGVRLLNPPIYTTSIPLAIDLLKNHNTTVVGTLRKNKREIPLCCFLETKKRQLNSTMFGYDKDILLTSYVPKKNKNALLISTMHEQGVINPESEERKPEVIPNITVQKVAWIAWMK